MESAFLMRNYQVIYLSFLTFADIPGLPGLFMAGVFSGSLSTISSGLNSLAAISLQFLPAERLRSLSSVRQALLTKGDILNILIGQSIIEPFRAWKPPDLCHKEPARSKKYP